MVSEPLDEVQVLEPNHVDPGDGGGVTQSEALLDSTQLPLFDRRGAVVHHAHGDLGDPVDLGLAQRSWGSAGKLVAFARAAHRQAPLAKRSQSLREFCRNPRKQTTSGESFQRIEEASRMGGVRECWAPGSMAPPCRGPTPGGERFRRDGDGMGRCSETPESDRARWRPPW